MTSTTNALDEYDLNEILKVAQEAARLAGAEIRQAMTMSSSLPRAATTNKSDTTDLVTETDTRCERLIIDFIRQRYPDHLIIGEESSGADCQYELTNAPTWTIDPIDGTTNFVHRLSLTCVLIAFLVNQQPVVGVCYDPMAEEMFWAIAGQGAFLQRGHDQALSSPQRLQVSGTTDVTQAVIAMDAGYGRTVSAVDRYLRVQRALLLQHVRHVRVLGCCGLTMAYVAAGRLDANVEQGSWQDNTGPKIWDLAAGYLLVHEAGGVTRDVTDATTRQQPLNLKQRSVFTAASNELADKLMTIIHDNDVKA